jgi:hypothetical protein
VRLALLIAVALPLSPATSSATWSAGGNPVCAASGNNVNLVAVPDGSGGIYIAWENRNPASAVFATHVLADGSIAAGWPVNGLQIDGGGAPAAVADGVGGLLVFFAKGIDIVPHMQSLNGDGSLRPGFGIGGPSGPGLFAAAGPAGRYARFAGDGGGGFYELHNGFNGTNDVLVLHRLTASCALAPGWASDGDIVGASPNNKPYVVVGLVQDPAGGALSGEIVTLNDLPSGQSQTGHIRRTRADGTLGFSDSLVPNGHDGTPSGHASVQQMSMMPDGSGGAFAAWKIGGPLGPAQYMQHFLANGSAAWSTPTTAPVTNAMYPDGAGGLYLLGIPLSGSRLELHRRVTNGSTPPGWGVAHVLPTTGPISSFAGVWSGAHFYACWSSGGGTADDVSGSAFLADGSLASGWSAAGNTVCGVAGQQSGVVMVPGTADDAFVVWIDSRSGTQDVYVTRLTPGGPAVSGVPPGPQPTFGFSVEPVRPNPAQDFAGLVLTLPDAAPATVEIVDLQGRALAHIEPALRSGPQNVSIPTSGLRNGLYWVRVRQHDHESSQRLSVFH